MEDKVKIGTPILKEPVSIKQTVKPVEEVKPINDKTVAIPAKKTAEESKKDHEKELRKLEDFARVKTENLKKQHIIEKVKANKFVLNHFHCIRCSGVMFVRGDGTCPRCQGKEVDFPEIVVVRE